MKKLMTPTALWYIFHQKIRDYAHDWKMLSKDLRVLLFNQFLMNASEFVAVPLMAVYLSSFRKFPPEIVAAILAVTLVTGHAMPIFTGPLVDKFGFRNLMCLGLFIRALALLLFPFFGQPLPLAIVAVNIGLGAAFYESAVYGIFGRQPAKISKQIFIFNNQALNLGAILGPAIGVYLSGIDLFYPFFVSGFLFLCVAIWCLRLGYLDTKYPSRARITESWRSALNHRPFLFFLLTTLPWWFLFSQLYVSFPLYGVFLTGEPATASKIFLLNGAVGLGCVILSLFVFSRLSAFGIVQFSFLALSAIYGIAPLFHNIFWFYAIVVLYSFPETIMMPAIDSITANLSIDGKQATFFGLQGLAWGIGGGIGYYYGSWMHNQVGKENLTWWIMSAVALAGCGGSAYLHARIKERTLLKPSEQQ